MPGEPETTSISANGFAFRADLAGPPGGEAPYRFVTLPGIGHFVTDDAPGAAPPLLLEHLGTAQGRS